MKKLIPVMDRLHIFSLYNKLEKGIIKMKNVEVELTFWSLKQFEGVVKPRIFL